MTVSSSNQLSFFFVSILAGLFCGAFYNLLTAVREKERRGCLSLFTDLLFWTAVGAALIRLSIVFNDGGIRGYQIFGAVIGFMLHYLCLSPVTLFLARWIVRIAMILLFPAAFFMRGIALYLKQIIDKVDAFKTKIYQYARRVSLRRKNHKKIQKNYKKML